MSFDAYLIFLMTTLVVVFSPGPAAITVASQGAVQGIRGATFGAGGVAFANVLYFALSATGVASLIIASNTLFSVIKWAGVLYLLYLGAGAIFRRSGGIQVNASGAPRKRFSCFNQGLVVELANPKALLYFSALVPQFVDVTQAVLPQMVLMGLTTVVIDLVAYNIYGLLGSSLAKGALKPRLINGLNKVVGGFLIFAGIKMAAVTANQ